MAPSLRKIIRRTRAAWNGVLGATWLRLGRLSAARRRFHRVLELRGDDFRAYLALSRIACAQGDYRGWRRESEHARRMAPERFARLNHRWSLPAPHMAGALLYEAGERATWRPSPPAHGPRAPGTALGSSRTADSSADRHGPERAEPLEWFDRETADEAHGSLDAWLDDAFVAPEAARVDGSQDDFSSEGERARFAAADPISQAEIAAQDLDDLVRRLGSC